MVGGRRQSVENTAGGGIIKAAHSPGTSGGSSNALKRTVAAQSALSLLLEVGSDESTRCFHNNGAVWGAMRLCRRPQAAKSLCSVPQTCAGREKPKNVHVVGGYWGKRPKSGADGAVLTALC